VSLRRLSKYGAENFAPGIVRPKNPWCDSVHLSCLANLTTLPDISRSLSRALAASGQKRNSNARPNFVRYAV
jgi:hypothetical protein